MNQYEWLIWDTTQQSSFLDVPLTVLHMDNLASEYGNWWLHENEYDPQYLVDVEYEND